jgi:hypothetical protein
MKYPGQPKSPPSWYKDRGQSYIEKEFSKEYNKYTPVDLLQMGAVLYVFAIYPSFLI